MVIGTNQVIRARFRRRIRAVGSVRGSFGERRIFRPQRSVHLVGGDMKKAKAFPLGRRQPLPVFARGVQQLKCSEDVGANEFFGPVDRPVDVRLGGKVHHRPRLIPAKQVAHQRGVGNVSAHERMRLACSQRMQILQIAGVSQGVEIHYRRRLTREPMQNEVGADETGAAGHQNGVIHRCSSSCAKLTLAQVG